MKQTITKLLGGALLALLFLMPSSVKAEKVTLADWQFSTLYEESSHSEKTYYYMPNTSGTYAGIGFYWYKDRVPVFYPQTYVGSQTSYEMTAASKGRYWQVGQSGTTFLNESTEVNEITDWNDKESHKVYVELSFPTTGYKDIELDFGYKSHNGVAGISVIVSTDGGTTWHKSDDIAAVSSLTDEVVNLGVANESSVKVRLLCENGKSGYSYFSYFTIKGNLLGETQLYSGSVSVDNASHGDAIIIPAGGVYESGSSVTVTATSKAGWKFQKWNDGSSDVSTENPYTFTISTNTTLTAIFEANLVERTITYYDVDGTSILGTQKVTDGNSIGTFAYTANPTAGYSFRGWYTAANGGGTKVTTETIVDDDMSIYAYQTETETYGPDKSYTFDFRTILNADYFDEHEAISISGGTRNGAHGWYFYNTQPISILVAGNSKIYVSLCSYSPDVKLRITYPNGTTDECDADPDGKDNNKDGNEHTFVYSGGTSGVATIATTSDYAYIHYIRIENSYGIIEVGNTGWASYITNEAVNFAGVTAYIVSAKDASTATLTAVASAPANTPVVINATEGEYTLTSEASPADVSGNKLQAATTEITADGSQYILANGGSGVGFYKATNGSVISAGKAYLSSSVSGHALTLNFDNGTTGINEVANQKSLFVGTCYNLAGQRVAAPAKGLYIVNGKKVIIK